MMRAMRSFHFTATFFLVLFIGVLALATGIAFSRKSGNTGIDAAKIQWMRTREQKK